MSVQAYDKKTIALKQLETALRLFFEGKDYFSVLTLAGAADEILGALLADHGFDNSFEQLKKAVNAIHERLYGEPLNQKIAWDKAYCARNACKHLYAGGLTLKCDIEQESKNMLSRAMDNFWLLEGHLTPLMERYQRELVNSLLVNYSNDGNENPVEDYT